MVEQKITQRCRYCNKQGSWPQICMSTRDMEEKPYDTVCHAKLMQLGGGEYTINQREAEQALQRMNARRNESATEWAAKLAHDLGQFKD